MNMQVSVFLVHYCEILESVTSAVVEPASVSFALVKSASQIVVVSNSSGLPL